MKTCINRFAMLCRSFVICFCCREKVQGVVISSEDNLPLIGASVYVTAEDLKRRGVLRLQWGSSLMWMVSSLSLYLRG